MDEERTVGREAPVTAVRHSNDSPALRPFPGWRGKMLSPAQVDKVLKILDVSHDGQEMDELIAMSTSKGGLVDDEVRIRVWPILLGCHAKLRGDLTDRSRWRQLPRHKDEDQVELDVNRSFVYYPKDETDHQLDKRKRELSDVITKVLREHPMLCYFQGFHDIVQVFLLVLGAERAPAAVARLSLLRIRDFMLPSLSPSLAHLNLLPAILQAEDPKLCLHLSTTQPFFALSATLTLYAHDIQEYGDIARLFDFLIAQPAVVAIYFFAIIVLSRRDELFEIPADEPEMLHSILSKLPKPLDLEALIARTVQAYNKSPPARLPNFVWWRVSPYSVLKTTQQPVRDQTVADGEILFAKQVKQLHRDEMRKRALLQLWKYRRPFGSLGVAVLVGVLSFWLRKNGTDGVIDVGLWRIWNIFRGIDFNDQSNPRSKIPADASAPFSTAPNQPPSKRFLWTLSFYAQFFDVDTSEVLRRCRSALYPSAPFLDILDGNPDLYGPFWIATTVVFILFITGTISQYLSDNHDIHFEYNFTLLSGAAGLVYGYTGFVPIGLWASLRWFGAESATLVECWALYGYANVIWIPVALISWSPISALNYVFVGLGFAWSVVFLVRNLWPVVGATDAKVSRVLVIAAVALHAGLTIAIKFLFFAHGSPANKKAGDADGE
ncbi:MAG: hypothetical protein Q9163_001022 [Psora crenata]